MTRNLGDLAATVDEAARAASAIAQLSAERVLSVDEAYAIQALSLGRRQARGERRIGVKMGLTSRAKMAQVGVDEVIWGRLTDAMLVEEGGEISLDGYVHPRAEPEIAFLLKAPLAGRVTAVEALAAVEAVAPAIEIIDSRYRDFRFDLADVVADNASSSGFVVGSWADRCIDFGNLAVMLEVDGRPAQIGSSAAILGHPLRSLVAAAAMVARWGERLEAGYVVLAGGVTAAEPLRRGSNVRAVVERLGSVGFKVAA